MRRFLIFVFLCCFVFLHARESEKSLLDALISKGNIAYELSQPSQIKSYADSVSEILSRCELSEDARKDYSVSLLKLYGNFHYEKASLDSAEYFYNAARKIMADNHNTDFHGNSLLLPREFAQLYYRQGRYHEAEQIMLPVYDDLIYNNRYDNAVNSDEYVRFLMSYAMCLARIGRFDEALEIATDVLENASDKNGLEYAKAQRMFAKIQLLANADRIGALNAYKAYFNSQKKHARLHFAEMTADQRCEYWQTLRPFVADCYLLEKEDPGFLYDVTLFSKGLLLQLSRRSGAGFASEDALKSLDFKWRDIQKKLGKSDACIEFIQYGDDADARMAALVLRQDGSPRFVPLTPPGEIMKITGTSLNSTSRTDKDRLYSDSILQSKVWTPQLLNAVKGAKRVFFAPDGYLHRMAIEYMPQVDDIDMCRLTSTRRLMEEKTSLPANSSMLAFGSINYDLDRTVPLPMANDPDAFAYYKGKRFPALDASADETMAILAQRNNAADSILSGAVASESVFRQIAPRFSSIILSTHGDFCADAPVSTDLKPVASDDAMSRSIIAFSGINSRLKNPAFDPASQCDGILSAFELSDLDLSRCRLFTASACQSALGSISSDGVFGLQRGLKNAGVDAMLLSLWNVNSESTSILMKYFYANVNAGMPLRHAFKEARGCLLSESVPTEEYVFDPATMSTKKTSGAARLFNTPQYTDAFILIDAVD